MKTIAISLKMYFDRLETLAWLEQAVAVTANIDFSGARIIVLPSTTELQAAVEITRPSQIEIGAQNVAAELSGAFTGEISVRNVAQLGCRVVETGHAERRLLFGEDDEIVARKSALIAAEGLEPLVCIGESIASSVDDASAVCRKQLDCVLDALPADQQIIVAYEPIWAIGAERPAPVSYINGILNMIREHLRHRRCNATLLYGGSAGTGLIASLPIADGLFLGRFAHDVRQLETVLRETLAI